MQLTGTVTSELRKARFLAGYLLRQMYFILNGKLGCKVLSSLKVFMYIYARLVAHQITQIDADFFKTIYFFINKFSVNSLEFVFLKATPLDSVIGAPGQVRWFF